MLNVIGGKGTIPQIEIQYRGYPKPRSRSNPVNLQGLKYFDLGPQFRTSAITTLAIIHNQNDSMSIVRNSHSLKVCT